MQMTELATSFPETPPDPDNPCRRCPVRRELKERLARQRRQYHGTLLVGATLMQKSEDGETFAGIEELSDGELDAKKIVMDMRKLVIAMMENAETERLEAEEHLDNTERSCLIGARIREAVYPTAPEDVERTQCDKERVVFSQCRSGGELSPTHVNIIPATQDWVDYA